jgi:hypothetical protein
MREGSGQLADAREATLQHFLTKVVQLEEYMIALGTAAATFENLEHHGTCNYVTARKIFGVRRIALHEALAILIDEVAALAATALGHQRAGAVYAGGVELPHLHVLHREARPQCHADAVAGIDVCVGGRGVDTSRHRRLQIPWPWT